MRTRSIQRHSASMPALDSFQAALAKIVLAVRDWSERFASPPVAGLDPRVRILHIEGEPLRVEEVASRLHITPEEADQLRRGGRLLALATEPSDYLYPSWQIDPRGADGLIPGLREILADLRDHDPVMQIAFFINGNLRLGGATPLAELRRGNVEAVHRAARGYGEHGAA